MKKRDIYTEFGMSEFIWGDSFIVERNESNEDIISEIDNLCVAENRNPLGEKWFEISFLEGSILLQNAFNFDLAYSSGQNMPKEKAVFYRDLITSKFNEPETKCFTNWDRNPWTSKKGGSWNPISENTFDMAVIFADNSKISFTYFISED